MLVRISRSEMIMNSRVILDFVSVIAIEEALLLSDVLLGLFKKLSFLLL